GAEDFSVYLETIPGLFAFLGARNQDKGIDCVHHHPAFDVDEDTFPDGSAIYARFAIDCLKNLGKHLLNRYSILLLYFHAMQGIFRRE
ncbi:MAG: hypothetical protein MR962_02465, partial [Dialister sp.]|nr:hypothetical protein [Dialister sp.]